MKAALALCLASLTLLGCSGGDGGRGDGAVEVGGGRGPSVGAEESGSFVAVERAYLSSAGEADLMDARVRFGGEGVWPDCFLVDGQTVEAMARAEERGGVYEGRVESPWASADTTEKRLDGEGLLTVSFHEAPGSDAPDPDGTTYFVYCTGGGRAGYDRAHVEGTPGP